MGRFRTNVVHILLGAMAAVICADWLQATAIGQTDRATPTADELTDAHIQAAIEAIVEELYNRKDPQHFWEPQPWRSQVHGPESQAGGYTALTVLSLLYAGQSYQDPRLRDAIDYLAEFGMNGTYAVALRAHIWAALPDRYRKNLEADTRWLIDSFSERSASWQYEPNPRTRREDNSIRQYAVLGMWEAAKRGVSIEQRHWQMLEDAFIRCQLKDGGWNYQADAAPPRGSMTAAGLTVLFITQDFLHARDALNIHQRRPAQHERATDDGMRWMEENFSPTFNPGRNADYYYYMYGVERVGLASGYKYFGTRDWFREGAAELIRRLCELQPDGSMRVHEKIAGDGRAGTVRTRYLAFSLMFLSRGRVPVAVNKLQVDEIGWNNRPRDVANLTAYLRDQTETDVNWQIMNAAAPVVEWLDAPLLYIASHEPLPWVADVQINVRQYQQQWRAHRSKVANGEFDPDVDSEPDMPELPESARKVKRYIDLGGTILAVDEGRRRGFADSIQTLGTLLYPQYEWRVLRPDHPIYSLRPIQGRKVRLHGLSNGVRELMIVSSDDLSASFQINEERRTDHFQTAANIYFHASDMNAGRARLQEHLLDQRSSNTDGPPLTIIRGIYDGNWNAEPAAAELLAHYLNVNHNLNCSIVDQPLTSLTVNAESPRLLWLSGTDAIEFSEEQQQAIKAFAESGGTVLFETAGGRGDFATAAEKTFAALLETEGAVLTDQPIITGEGIPDANDLARVDYRLFAHRHMGGRRTTPMLRGIPVNDQPRLLFSNVDLSFGQLDQPQYGIVGYTPQSARQLLANIALWVAQQPDAEHSP